MRRRVPSGASPWLRPAVLACLIACACERAPDRAPGPHADAHPIHAPATTDTAPQDLPGLHNVVAFHDAFWSGSTPEQDGFATLAAMGVRTIISVDGAAPDVEGARAHGIRYIHLPIGYDGFDESRELQLARATQDARQAGAVYIHCHHGKHRSASAAGTIAVNLGWATPDAMVARMKVSGTSPSYPGLYACTSSAEPLAPERLRSIPADFPEVSTPTGIVASMVQIDEILEHLRAIEAAAWTVPTDHPDLVPVAEAGRLESLFRSLSQATEALDKGPGFVEMMLADAHRTAQLEAMLDQHALPSPTDPAPPTFGTDPWRAELTRRLDQIAASCNECHAAYRD